MRCVNNNCECNGYGPLDDTGNMHLNCPLCGEEAEVGEKELDWDMWNRERREVATYCRDKENGGWRDPEEVHAHIGRPDSPLDSILQNRLHSEVECLFGVIGSGQEIGWALGEPGANFIHYQAGDLIRIDVTNENRL